MAMIRVLTEADASELYELRLRALQESPEAFGSTYAETVRRGVESYRQRLQQPLIRDALARERDRGGTGEHKREQSSHERGLSDAM